MRYKQRQISYKQWARANKLNPPSRSLMNIRQFSKWLTGDSNRTPARMSWSMFLQTDGFITLRVIDPNIRYTKGAVVYVTTERTVTHSFPCTREQLEDSWDELVGWDRKEGSSMLIKMMRRKYEAQERIF
ncbi:MAG: hypothetical protein DSZ04_03010 [Sulfurimonas sp.]|nr:MAG: hypothetical protein DSZ04_03010 [Sulfurimonas sp.]